MSSNQSPYGGKYTVKKKDPLRPFYPIIGLIILVVAGAIAYFSAPFILEFITPYLPPSIQLPDEQTTQIVVAILVFFIIIGIFGLIFALFAPKPPKMVTEAALLEERKQKEAERKRAVLRKRKMRARMKASVRENEEI